MLQIHETDLMSFVNAQYKTPQNTGIDNLSKFCKRGNVCMR